MAVPKRKTSRQRRNQRSSTWGLQMKSFSHCPNTGEAVLPHTVCLKSGYYKGVKVMETKADRAVRRAEKRKKTEARTAPQAAATEVAPEIVEAVKEAKKTAVKKAAVKKEAK